MNDGTAIVTLPHDDAAERAVLGAVLVADAPTTALAEILKRIDAGKFYSTTHAKVFRALRSLADRGSALDLVTLRAELESRGELEACGGAPGIATLIDGVQKSKNAVYYAGIVAAKARRRDVIGVVARLSEAAMNGTTEADFAARMAEAQAEIAALGVSPDGWTVSTLEEVTSESTGETAYVADKLLPVGALVIVGATWKSGKTLAAYRLALDLVRGARVFGMFPVPEAVPVAVFQLEMQPAEDARRLRRLAIGAGIYPAEVPGYVESGALKLYNRPDGFTLTTPGGVARFLSAVKESGARVVIVDSLIAAFAGAELNDNSTVRRLLSDAFGPLTSAGVTVVALHHKRKGGGNGKPDAERDALLGAQAFGAAADRVYALERIDGGPETKGSSFRLRLSVTGSWTPEETPDVILEIADDKDGGTSIVALDEGAQYQRGGVTTVQKAALHLSKIVRTRGRVKRKDAIAEVRGEFEVSDPTAKRALEYARVKGWVSVVKSDPGSPKERDLVPGETA